MLGLCGVQRIETGLLHEGLGNHAQPDIVKIEHSGIVDHGRAFILRLAVLRQAREHRVVQAQVYVHGNRVDVLAACRRDRGVDHCDDRDIELQRDAK